MPNTAKALALCLFALLGLKSAAFAAPHVLTLDPRADGWRTAATGPYDVVLDIRDLYQISAHWEISRAGNHGALSTYATIPADWVKPYKLRFFHADDYQAWGIDRTQAADWFAETGFIGHRFKQVLVDGRVVWEQDAADTGTGQYQEVDLSWAVVAGRAFELTFRLYDKVASDQALEADYARIRSEKFRPKDHPQWYEPSTYLRFETRSYWGDMVLYDSRAAAAEIQEAQRFDWLKDARPQRGWERGSSGVAPEKPLALRLETDAPQPLPQGGYSVRSGVPFARGMLPPDRPIELRNPAGKQIPVQTAISSRWPDGSVKWLLLDFVAHPDDAEKHYSVVWRDASPQALPQTLQLEESDGALVLSNGLLSCTIPAAPGPDLLTDITLAEDEVAIANLTGTLDCRVQDGEEKEPPGPLRHYVAERQGWVVESHGSLRATVRVHGRLVDERGEALGNLVLRLTAWVGMPYLHLTYRIFNGSAHHRRLERSRLTLQHSGAPPRWAGMSPLRCTAADAQNPGLDGLLGTAGFGIGVRHFWQQFPKAILPATAALHLDLYHPIDPPGAHNWLAAGEAKRHELLLSFAASAAENQRALHAFQRPPRLFDKEWHNQSGGWGPTAWHDSTHFPQLHEAMAKYAKTVAGNTTWGNEYGRRNFGDGRYGEGWYNNYYDMAYALMAEYLMGGARTFYHQAETMVLHLMDVDVVHDNAADASIAEPGFPTLWDAYAHLPAGPPTGHSTGAVRAFGSSRHHNLTPKCRLQGLVPPVLI